MGIGSLNDKSGQELVLSNFGLHENVVDLLNDDTRLYFSLLYGRSLSAKKSDEKELYIIKTIWCYHYRSWVILVLRVSMKPWKKLVTAVI